MVTKIVNNGNETIEFYVPNINAFFGDKTAIPIKRTVAPGETIYSRSVTGDTATEEYLTKRGCTLSQVMRNYIIAVVGQSNAVGYDESPWRPQDCEPLPYCYFEALEQHGDYSRASSVPMIGPSVDNFQSMRGISGMLQDTLSIHKPLARELIKSIPDDYELLICGWAYGNSGLLSGDVGTIDGTQIPSGSTKWNSDGMLTHAVGRRIKFHLNFIQPESKFVCFVWCQGERDGQNNVSGDDYATAFKATANKIWDLIQNFKSGNNVAQAIDWYSKSLYGQFAVNSENIANQLSSPYNKGAFVEYTGGEYYVAAMTDKPFGRNKFRTNLLPRHIKMEWYRNVDTSQTADDGGPVFSNRNDGAFEINFNTMTFKCVDWDKTDKDGVSIHYCKFINAIDNSYIGYIVVSGRVREQQLSQSINYRQENTKAYIHYPLWVVYPGPQAYWNTKGTYKEIIAKQKEMFSFFVDLPENLPTNATLKPSGTKTNHWKWWNNYGRTSSALASHYGAYAFDYIAKAVGKKILEMNAMALTDERSVE